MITERYITTLCGSLPFIDRVAKMRMDDATYEHVEMNAIIEKGDSWKYQIHKNMLEMGHQVRSATTECRKYIPKSECKTKANAQRYETPDISVEKTQMWEKTTAAHRLQKIPLYERNTL